MNDQEAIQAILKGDRDKYSILVERYQVMVFKTCMGFLHNKEDAEDLTQDIFVLVYQSLSKFKGESQFPTWLYKITVNSSLNKLRKTPLQSLFNHSIKNTAIHIPFNETPEDLLINEEQRLLVQRALDSLPENQRTAIVLSKYDDLSQKEIAEIMNLSEGAVESLIQRAKANLRKKLIQKSKKNGISPKEISAYCF
jgi:RNA polymerase sigma-70 factor (ECF subfamily)